MQAVHRVRRQQAPVGPVSAFRPEDASTNPCHNTARAGRLWGL